MAQETYMLKLTDFKPYFGREEFQDRNLHLRYGKTSYERNKFMNRDLLLMTYNFALAAIICGGATLAAIKGLESFLTNSSL